MSAEIFDLFGNPVRPGKGQRGRPSFEVTERNRNKVKLLLALGWSGERIANAIDCSLATLKRYFRAELTEREKQRDRLEAERLMAVAEKAFDEGIIGAHRELDRLIERNDRMEAERSVSAKRPTKSEPAGKKEARSSMARDADADLMAELEREANSGARH